MLIPSNHLEDVEKFVMNKYNSSYQQINITAKKEIANVYRYFGEAQCVDLHHAKTKRQY
jgi:hypothetical protein